MRLLNTFLFSLIIATTASHARETVFIDLSQAAKDSVREFAAGKVKVVAINAIPGRDYERSCSVVSLLGDALPAWPSTAEPTDYVKVSTCDRLQSAVESLEKATHETAVASYTAEIRRLLPQCTPAPGDSGAPQRTLKEYAPKLLAMTTFEVCERTIEAGDNLNVQVARADAIGQPVVWTYRFEEPSGRWFMSYGFTFVKDRNDRYFTRAAEDEMGKFDIVEQRDNLDYELIPTALFHFLPKAWRQKNVAHSLVAGLGIEGDQPAVLLGYSLLFNVNVGVVAGVAIHTQDRLQGRFTDDARRIGEDLSDEQLVEQTYRPNAFFGVSFRFGSAPKTHKSK